MWGVPSARPKQRPGHIRERPCPGLHPVPGPASRPLALGSESIPMSRLEGYSIVAGSLNASLSSAPVRPPGPAAGPLAHDHSGGMPVAGIVRFYLSFLSAMARRQEDVRGMQLGPEIERAFDSERDRLLKPDRGLLPAAGEWQRPAEFISRLDDRLGTNPVGAVTVRTIYDQVLQEILSGLKGRLDDSLVRLLFRLSLRDAMKENGDSADMCMLLGGIPRAYLNNI